ncbi:tRNA(Met) cytidine acetyltransferase [Pseudenhygromyxa sp. WMMC2535]|uniref:GNAT family N-acetyltransferase n=1 Tax=Pseudenhygromyxa sp. WMMC2535 TaxID=2712867 RepID=UPI0015963128|nr:GNAT family N-acetyltransferase [Pseudenhygromyxa sp. WMMC2535]NVB42274.1 tRNA(Met) cytidine acetyltransferase [Pseudenhygromyxa sp. WMMC2535]
MGPRWRGYHSGAAIGRRSEGSPGGGEAATWRLRMPSSPTIGEGHRRLFLLRGEAGQTCAEVGAMLGADGGGGGEGEGDGEGEGEGKDDAELPSLLWISDSAPPEAEAATWRCAWAWTRPRGLAARLGQAFDVVVIDAHEGLDADVLGQAQGLVWGGGALILRLARGGDSGAGTGRSLAKLAAYPYGREDVGRRFEAHVLAALEPWRAREPGRLRASAWRLEGARGNAGQREVVARLCASWSRPGPPSRSLLLADRGRGKSSALGLALREYAACRGSAGEAGAAEGGQEMGERGPLIVTAAVEAAAAEVLRFAGEAARFEPVSALLERPLSAGVLVVDEAAQLPVPLLRRLVSAHPGVPIAFATTVHGYEGTGRGFCLRFEPWLRRQAQGVERLRLDEPIRWAADDPLERAIFAALLLDAAPAELEAAELEPSGGELAGLVTRRLDRDALAGDLPRLRALFGLLVQAHYRTTPGDLQRLLDAPNLEVHAAELDGRIVAATLVAEEGGLPPELVADALAGKTRLRAHALADALVAHLGHPEAGAMIMRRSVRIAVHPRLRRRGVATRLIEHVHADGATPPVALFGTLFGASAGVIALRRSLGYALVRVGASRGARTGEPSVLMLRPQTPAGEALVAALRWELAHELDVQLALLQADEGVPLNPELVAAVREGLPCVPPWRPAERRRLVRAYAHGPRTFESVATALREELAQLDLDLLPPSWREVIVGRAVSLRAWRDVARAAGLPDVRAAMRIMRRGVRLLVASDP